MDYVEYIARENTDANEDLVLLVATVHSVSIRRSCPSSSCFNLVVSASSASIHRRSSSSRRCYRPLRLCRRWIQSRSIRIEMIGEASILMRCFPPYCSHLKSVVTSRSIFEWY